MSYIFESVTGSKGALSFKFNGQFALKNYNVEIVNGNRLKVVSTANEAFSLLEADVSEVEINGTIYSDPAAAQLALTSLVYSDAEPVVLTKEKYMQLAAAVQAADRGVISPTTPIPSGGWQKGWYKPKTSSEAPGTNYPNAGDMKAVKGFINRFYFDGLTWENIKESGTEVAASFDPSNELDAQGGKQIADYFSTVKVLNEIIAEITERIQGGVINDSGQFVAINGYNTTGLVNVSDAYKINIVGLNPPTDDYSVKFYDANNNMILNHRQIGTYELTKPLNAVFFMMNVVTATTHLECYKVKAEGGFEDLGTSSKVDVNTGSIKYKPVNSVGVNAFLADKLSGINSVNVYRENIKSVILNIDSFTGNDDQKIEKAVAMIENVGGGQIYFPSRQINITKSILIPSNSKFILDNCQIQMANGIHDNIFRSKGLQINSSAPNGEQPGASWTENFEIIGIGTPTMRQSVQPLHVGDAYGWRGISVLLVKCRNYSVKNIKVIESHMWSISNEYSENGYFENLEFANTLHPNADGLNFRNGCRNMYAKKLRGITNDNAVAVTILDGTWPNGVGPNTGYTWQALGVNYGDYQGAENIVVEDVQVKSKYGAGLIIGTSKIVQNITFKDFVSSQSSGYDWDNVSVCGNRFRTYVYGTSYVDGNVRNINIINSSTSVHEYSLAVYGGRIDKLYAVGIANTNPSAIGLVKNDTTTVIN